MTPVVGPVLAERAPSEGPRSTRAVVPTTGAISGNENEQAWREHLLSSP